MAKITWDEIFDLNGDSPLNKVNESIQAMEEGFSEAVSNISSLNQKLVQELAQTETESEALLAAVQSMNIALDNSGDSLQTAANKTAELAAQQNAAKTAFAENTAAINALTAQIQILSDAKEKIKKTSDDEINSLNDLKARLAEAEKAYRAMGDATSQAVKTEALNNIKELSKQVTESGRALTDAKKATDAAADSYNALSKRVQDARKELKNMEGGLDSNSAKVQELKSFIKNGNDTLKEFDNSIGDNTRHVGDYAGQIGKLIPQFGELRESGSSLLETFGKLAASPVGLVLLGLVAVFIALKEAANLYTENTIEGQDKMNESFNRGAAVLDIIKEKAIGLGRSVYNAFTSATEAVLKLVANGDAVNDKLSKLNEISRLQNELRKEEIKLIVETADNELQKNEQLFIARDKLNHTLEERYTAIKAAGTLIDDQAKRELESANKQIEVIRAQVKEKYANFTLDQNSADLLTNTIAVQKIGYELVENLAKAEAKRSTIQNEVYQGSRRRQALEFQLVNEEVQHELDAQKQIREAKLKGDDEIWQDDIAQQQRILTNQSRGLEQRLGAEVNIAASLGIIQRTAQEREIQAAHDETFKRIELTQTQNEEIELLSNGSLTRRAQLEIQYKNLAVASDKTFTQTREQIIKASDLKIEAIYRLSGENVVKIIKDYNKAVAEAEANKQGVVADKTIIDLNERYKNGLISLREFTTQKNALETEAKQVSLESQKSVLQAELDYYTSSKELSQKYANDILKIKKDLADKDVEISKNAIKLKEQFDTEYRQAEIQLQQQVFASIQTILQNRFSAEQQQYQNRISELQTQMNTELALTGNNAEEKARIQREYNQQIAEEQQKAKKAQHDQAVYERDLAAVQIAINIAEAIAKAFGTYPYPYALALSAVLAATGVAEEAAVFSKPIPSYQVGTDSSVGGLARINEAGPEIIVDKKTGLAKMYDTPGAALTYLNEGSKIFTAKETKRILEGNDFEAIGSQFRKEIVVSHQDGALEYLIGVKFDELNHTIRNKKELHITWTEAGLRSALRDGASWINFVANNYP